jgi:hypothetical protein
MWRATVIAYALVTSVLVGRADAQTPVVFGFVDASVRFAVVRATKGAAARLVRPGCQQLLSDFANTSGHALLSALEASGRSPTEVFSQLRFVDDSGARQCRARTTTLAFTQTGSRVIHVCGPQFKDRWVRDSTGTEIVVIHEFLHALGLGENPPTSEAITSHVSERCSD